MTRPAFAPYCPFQTPAFRWEVTASELEHRRHQTKPVTRYHTDGSLGRTMMGAELLYDLLVRVRGY